MSIELFPAVQNPPPPTRSLPPRPQPRGERENLATGPRRRRGLLAIGVVAVLALVAAMIPLVKPSQETGPKLTHTVTRGDLVVSVTGQGTLESAENVEIKCKVRGANIPIIWVIEGGSEVKPGDELVRLETLEFEDRVNEVTKWTHATRSAAERSKADLANANLAVSAYLEGRYLSELTSLEKDLAIAEANLRTAQNFLNHAEMMNERGYVSELDVEERAFAVTRAELNVKGRKTAIDVLQNFTKAMRLETLGGTLKATTARHEANKERSKQLAGQLVQCDADLDYCVVKAERSGMVIYPTAEPWKHAPKIEVGATVYMGQTMLLMPDLSQMQVKVGIPESVIDRIKPGLPARVTLPDKKLDAEVSSVASVAPPAGWWTGNAVKYDTIIKLPSIKGLHPGMSAEVEVIIDRHENVLTIPVAAVVETEEGSFCWVKTAKQVQRRPLTLGDTNDVYTIVETGLQEGDEVVLDATAFLNETQTEILKPIDKKKAKELELPESGAKSKQPESSPNNTEADS